MNIRIEKPVDDEPVWQVTTEMTKHPTSESLKLAGLAASDELLFSERH